MLEIQKFPENMSALPINREEPRRCLLSGLFEEATDVGGTVRRFYSYLTPGLCYNQPCIIVAAPENTDGPEYLESSPWIAFADEHKVFLFLAVPENGKWDLNGMDADYFNKVYLQVNSRRSYVTMQDNIYAFGVGTGATIAQQAVMKMSTEWSGLATFGDLEPQTLLNAAATAVAENTGRTELFISAAKVSVPVWMSWAKNCGENQQVCTYWKTMNEVDDECFSNSWADEIYFPNKVVKKSQINEEHIAQVRVTNDFVGEPDQKRLNTVWEYLRLACRHRGFGVKQLRYRIDPEKYGFTFHTMEHQGFRRCWYEYVPQKVRESGTPAPLVLCMHGRGGTAESFISLSGMSRVAEERNFIVVFPEAGVSQQRPDAYRNLLLWNGSYDGVKTDDTDFLLKLIEDVKSRNAVDTTRIYPCGQSSGGMMTTSLALKAPQLFAAAAPWSALTDPDTELVLPDRLEPAVPFLFLFGDKDFLCAGESGGELHVSDRIEAFLTNLVKIYGLETEPGTYQVGEITYYVYRNAKGTPMLTVGRVKDMPHANYPRESWITYDEFLSKFSRAKDGTLLYMGKRAI